MSARQDSPRGLAAGSFSGRVLLVGAVAFAAAATGLLVLTDQEKWLRLGIVAALWAALTGAFLAARYRRQVTDQREAAAERQRIYELELEREIAARREHELTVEAEAKRRAEESSREDITALRSELQNLRQTLEGLLSGDVLVERYALQAEATRMRSLGDDRSLAVRREVKHLPSAKAPRDAETELIGRVHEPHQKPRREQHRPEPRTADSRPPSVPRRPGPPPRPERPTPEPVMPTQTQQPSGPLVHPAEVSDRWFVQDGLAEQQPPAPRRPEQQRSEQPRRQEPRPAEPQPRRAMAPAWETPVPGMPAGTQAEQSDWLAQYNQAQQLQQRQAAEPTYGSRAYVPQPGRQDQPSMRNMPAVGQPSMRNVYADQQAGQQTARDQPSMRNMPAVQNQSSMRDVWAQQPGAQAARSDQPSMRNMPPVQQPSMRNVYADQPGQQTAREPSMRNMPPVQQPSMRTVYAEQPGRPAEPEPETGGGRRRRAEGQPAWQEAMGRQVEERSSGSHTSGRSVSELLASNGLDSSPRRRRRRED
jgi:hypothetical protein